MAANQLTDMWELDSNFAVATPTTRQGLASGDESAAHSTKQEWMGKENDARLKKGQRDQKKRSSTRNGTTGDRMSTSVRGRWCLKVLLVVSIPEGYEGCFEGSASNKNGKGTSNGRANLPMGSNEEEWSMQSCCCSHRQHNSIDEVILRNTES